MGYKVAKRNKRESKIKGEIFDKRAVMDVIESSETPIYDLVDAIEKFVIEEALVLCRGNQAKASRLIGMNRQTLAKRVKQFGLVE